MQKYPELYKYDSMGRARVWYMERDGAKYRTWDGLQDGKIKCSLWQTAEPTNDGKANARNAEEQAEFIINSSYENRLTRKYHKTLEGASGGAHIFEVMLAEKYSKFEPGFANPKLDGIRAIATKDGMFSRAGKKFATTAHIEVELKHLFDADPNLVFDGELYNHDYKEDFEEIVSLVKKKEPNEAELIQIREKLQYHVYDIASRGDMKYGQRATFIEIILRNKISIKVNPFAYVNTQEEYDELHGQWLEEGYEGSMWRSDTHYENKRTKALQKRKDFIDEEFECVEILQGKGNWAGVAKKVVARLPDGRTFGAGIKGSRDRAKTLLWETHKIVTIRYFRLTGDGIPRFGVATKFHGEKRDM